MLLLRAVVATPPTRLPRRLVSIPGGVTAIASEVDAAPSATEASLRRHQAIADAIHRVQPCLPARFGRLYPDEAALGEALRGREHELRDALQRIADRVELAVVLEWRGEGRGAIDRTDGTSYLRSLGEREAGRREAEHLVARLAEELHLERAFVRHRTCSTDRIAASVAVLARRDEVTRIKRTVARFSRCSAAVRAEVYGPMAPYSFAP